MDGTEDGIVSLPFAVVEYDRTSLNPFLRNFLLSDEATGKHAQPLVVLQLVKVSSVLYCPKALSCL